MANSLRTTGLYQKNAFSLVELLVVISTITVLISIGTPALVKARCQAKSVFCKSNIRQLVLANICYSNDYDGFCVPAAVDMYKTTYGGNHRWHGTRTGKDAPFDPNGSPLAEYLLGGKIKECPGMLDFVQGNVWNESFEKGCGGYGYNMAYIGSKLSKPGLTNEEKYTNTAGMAEIRKLDKTIMFADCAMSKTAGSYIEYSFAEPPHVIISGKVYEDIFYSPSIHFRHGSYANFAWSDAHVDSRKMLDLDSPNIYSVVSSEMMLAWPEPLDNSLFDLE